MTHSTFDQRIIGIHGERGAVWLAELPSRIAACAPARPSCTRDRRTAPRPRGSSALRAWHGHGVARLIDADAVQGAVRLEQLQPGSALAELVPMHDDDATAIAAELACELHRAEPPSDLPTLAVWTEGHCGQVLVPRARMGLGQRTRVGTELEIVR